MKTWKNKTKDDYKYDGEWVNEPDKAHWVDKDTGLDCLIVRNIGGALCGYVGVPESHCAFKKEYDNVNVEIHGGLTFSDFCADTDDEGIGICHPRDGAANDVVWWLGFDCAHYGDISPLYMNSFMFYDEYATYKNFDYVKSEVQSLAKKLTAIVP